VDEDDSYLASVSDLMVGMLFVFIIMLMGFALSYRDAEDEAQADRARLTADAARMREERAALAAERDALLAERARLSAAATELLRRDEARADLLGELRAALEGQRVPVSIDAANGVLRLPEALLFDSGAATLRPEGKRALQALADALVGVAPCLAQPEPSGPMPGCAAGAQPLLEAVLIEGHTDEMPLRGGAFADNWQLAAARAVNTFKALTAYRGELERWRNGRGEALLGVSAYEARRPVVQGGAAEQRRLNRRIDLRFLVAAPVLGDLAALRRDLDAAGGP
jgi:flagellar motor protein MotB